MQRNSPPVFNTPARTTCSNHTARCRTSGHVGGPLTPTCPRSDVPIAHMCKLDSSDHVHAHTICSRVCDVSLGAVVPGMGSDAQMTNINIQECPPPAHQLLQVAEGLQFAQRATATGALLQPTNQLVTPRKTHIPGIVHISPALRFSSPCLKP